MATDYDAPRATEEESRDESIEALKADRSEAQSGKVDLDEDAAAVDFELPGADLSHVELAIDVVPMQADEFTCMRCFLVQHGSRRAAPGADVCLDCD